MLHVFDAFRDISTLSVGIRLLMAVLCGGVIGLEREYKRRPAGFRTHILICLGASVTTLTSHYLLLYMECYTDVGRLGAQVIAGIGFIGAGCILVTRNRRVRGLTTAAGLCSAAIIGLAIGAGFYEGAIYATLLVLLAEMVLTKLKYLLWRDTPEINLYLECTQNACLDQLMQDLRMEGVKILDLEITRATACEQGTACALLTLQLHKQYDMDQLLREISDCQGVMSVEQF